MAKTTKGSAVPKKSAPKVKSPAKPKAKAKSERTPRKAKLQPVCNGAEVVAGGVVLGEDDLPMTVTDPSTLYYAARAIKLKLGQAQMKRVILI